MNSTGISLVFPWHENDRVPFQRYPARQPLEKSYATQWYRLSIDGVEYELRPSETRSESELVSDGPARFILSAWNPDGAATDFETNQQHHARLDRVLTELGLEHSPCVTFAEDSSWFEQSWLVSRLDEDAARFIASTFRQLAVMRWDADGLFVVAIDGKPVPSQRTFWSLMRLDQLPCPMKIADRFTQCEPQGGSWVSKSMAVGAVWHEHRRMITSLVGCGACGAGSERLTKSNGTPLLLRPLLLASRFGGYVWDETRWNDLDQAKG